MHQYQLSSLCKLASRKAVGNSCFYHHVKFQPKEMNPSFLIDPAPSPFLPSHCFKIVFDRTRLYFVYSSLVQLA